MTTPIPENVQKYLELNLTGNLEIEEKKAIDSYMAKIVKSKEIAERCKNNISDMINGGNVETGILLMLPMIKETLDLYPELKLDTKYMKNLIKIIIKYLLLTYGNPNDDKIKSVLGLIDMFYDVAWYLFTYAFEKTKKWCPKCCGCCSSQEPELPTQVAMRTVGVSRPITALNFPARSDKVVFHLPPGH